MRLLLIRSFASLLIASFSGAIAGGASCDKDLISELKSAEQAGQIFEAQRCARLLIERSRATDPTGPLLPAALEHAASLAQDQTHFDEAERLYEESIALWAQQPKTYISELATALNGLGSLYDSFGRLERAETLCRRALALRLESMGPNNVDVAISYSNLGVTLFRQQKWLQAEAAAQRALAIWDRLHSDQDRSAVDLNTLALLALEKNDYQAAIALGRKAIDRSRRAPPADQWSLVSYLHTLAVVYWKAGQPSAALVTFADAVCALESIPLHNLLETGNVLGDYATVLRETGQKRKAKRIYREAKAARAEIAEANPSQRYVVDLKTLTNAKGVDTRP